MRILGRSADNNAYATEISQDEAVAAAAWKGRLMAADAAGQASAVQITGGKPAEPEPRPGVYEHLIGNDEDVVGLLAYALYKQEKRDWLATWRAQNSGSPTAEHLNGFVSANMTQGQRQRYRNAARQALETYLATHYDGAPSVGADDHASDRLWSALQRLETGGGSWVKSLGAGALGAAVVVVVVAVVLVVFRLEGFGLLAAGS